MSPILECVPNFSEGRDPQIIQTIVQSAGSVPGAHVLHVDSGAAANRTVVTFAGAPEVVVEAAFRAVRTAAERIDMRNQHGEHPRIGATDVLPLVPVCGIDLETVARLARQLAERVGQELGIPVYCYEAAASSPERKGLEACRRGQYEGLREKMSDPLWKPDYGPQEWSDAVARTGASVIGARDFLGAVNFNLAPSGAPAKDVAAAKAIAREVRAATRGPWSLPGVKAIGWWIEEYGMAQVSTNLTDMHATGLSAAYDAVSAAARRHRAAVIGTEVIGLLPEWVLADVDTERLGLDSLRPFGRPFDPDRKIIERLLPH
ncbi:glutamate formimidoyltransferase [uncultured Rikenella sp.]|uniref:glutamate formimidoyltransferase n=1 Tax=uncultured Rikenella sp. TaxID=368003 RepID=UPI0025CFCB17|nr:glutamate formimidoyltransferase [uncultured Rikenella sp.]